MENAVVSQRVQYGATSDKGMRTLISIMLFLALLGAIVTLIKLIVAAGATVLGILAILGLLSLAAK